MTEVHTCILWRFLSLGKEPIKSSKRVVSGESSCVFVKTESVLVFPADVGRLCWFRRWSPVGFLPSPPPHRESVDLEIYFQSLGQWAVIVIWNGSKVTSNAAPFVLISAHHCGFTDMFLNIHILKIKYCQNEAWKIWGQALKMFGNLLILNTPLMTLILRLATASTRPFSENAPKHIVT